MKNRVAEIRKQKGEKQETCARLLGISRVSLSVIENGGTPSAVTMLKIARHFETAIEEIFFESDVIQKQHRLKGGEGDEPRANQQDPKQFESDEL